MKSKDKRILIVGRKAVEEAIERGDEIQKVMIQKGITGEMEKHFRQLCKTKNIPYQTVPPQVINKWTQSNHQGLIAIASPIRFSQVDDIIHQCYVRGEVPFFIALDEVQDVRNLGAIARSAEIFGAHGLIFPQKGSAIINDFAIKSSAGALLLLPLIRVKSLQTTIRELQNNGIQILAADMGAEKPIHSLNLKGPLCILMGSEGSGIRPHLRRIVDKPFKITQFGQTESLNVSVAAGIALHHVALQRDDKTAFLEKT